MKKHTWHPLSDHPEIRVGQYIVPNFVSNSVAIRLNRSEYIVYSPGQSLLDAWQQAWPDCANKEDTTLHIVMPNNFHYMGVSAWQAAFPQHKLYASNQAIPRLSKMAIRGNIDAIDILPLPDDYQVLLPPGHRAGDVWLSKKNNDKSSLWITCDSFLNYDRVSNQPFARLMQKLLGAAPGLKISQVVKWFIISDRKAFKSWALKQLTEDKPRTLIPSHGEVTDSNALSAELQQLISQRL